MPGRAPKPKIGVHEDGADFLFMLICDRSTAKQVCRHLQRRQGMGAARAFDESRLPPGTFAARSPRTRLASFAFTRDVAHLFQEL